MNTTGWDLVAILALLIVACLLIWDRHRRAMVKLDVARYHAHGDIQHWGKTTLLGRKEMRVCPDCGVPVHDYRRQEQHHEHHMYVDGLADRIAALEQVIAEARGGGPVEETPAIPWDGLTGELTEHAGAVDVSPDELEARADEPEPEEFKTFREKYGSLIRP